MQWGEILKARPPPMVWFPLPQSSGWVEPGRPEQRARQARHREPAQPQAQVEHHPDSAWEREQARANHREQEPAGRVRVALGRGRHREPVARGVVAVGPRS